MEAKVTLFVRKALDFIILSDELFITSVLLELTTKSGGKSVAVPTVE
jgi:hypothetical protein